MKFSILTLFPEIFPGPLNFSVIGNAFKNKKFQIEVHDIRKFSNTKSKKVDDSPFGGGAGMVIKPDVLQNSLNFVKNNSKAARLQTVYLSPSGKSLNQKIIKKQLFYDEIILICGRYEGIDQRFIDYNKIKEISVGDYVLSGGEIAAFILIDACVRLIPEVLGNKNSLNNESFENNLLEHPQYTKPVVWEDLMVPKVLLSGNHEMIAKWRLNKAQEKTKKIRPDLWKLYIDKQGN